MTGSSDRHIPALDGLRGLAIVLVLLFHTTIVPADAADFPAAAVLHDLCRSFGWTGVDLFFVLSGFLITGLLYDARGGRGARRNFYARRVLRIFPVYYGFLFLALVVLPVVHPAAARHVTVGDDAIWYWLYLQNFAIAASGDWVHSRFLDLFWSLAIEEQFYLVWPWVVFALSRRALLGLCAALVVAAPLLRIALVAADVAPVAIYVLTPCRIDTLAAGAWVAVFVRGPAGAAPLVGPARVALLAGLVAVLAVVMVQASFDYRLPLTIAFGYSALVLVYAGLLVLALAAPARSRLSRALASGPARTFGRTSYTLYVIHQPVIVLVAGWLLGLAVPWLAPEAAPLALQIVLYAVAVPAALLLAEASWRFYERPILRLKRRFPRRGTE